MVLNKSKPITRQLEYLQNQYSSQTAVLDMLTQQVTAQFEVDQNRQQQQLSVTKYLLDQARADYDKQLDFATKAYFDNIDYQRKAQKAAAK